MTATCLSFRAMNTSVEIRLEPEGGKAADDQEIADAMNHVRLWFRQVESTCSRFLPDSELSELNRSSGRPVAVSPLLFDLLQAARDAFAETGGIFHPAVLPSLEEAGYAVSFERIGSGRTSSHFTGTPVLPELPYQLPDPHKKTVLLQDGARIDLGGIAKGWTADRAAEYLAAYGSGFVNAGGDIRVFGNRKTPWMIGIENPYDPDQDLAVLAIKKGAVATSSTWKRRWQLHNVWLHHLIDPATGRPSESPVVSATVTAPTAAQADVWAKVALLLGPEKGLVWLRERKARAILVDNRQQIWRV